MKAVISIMDASDISRIARLAKLATETGELDQYARELTRILALVEQMQKVDTTAIEPLAHPLELTQRLRPDQVTERDQREHFQSRAPLTEGGFYLVPRVIE